MLVSFSVSNFRSFSSEETLSLVASNRLSAHSEHTVPVPDSKERVLRAAVIYGANGAGKSNLFKALKYAKVIALNPRKKGNGTGRTAFRFKGTREEPSCFDLQFIAEGKLYRFGFKVSDQSITQEWLAQVIGEKETTLYERITDGEGKVTIGAEGLKAEGEKLSALAKVGGPQNQSFLATINVTLNASDLGPQLRGILNWFKHNLTLIEPDEPLAPIGTLLADDQDFRNFASDFLRSSSTGVDHLDVLKKEISEDELRKFLPKDVQSAMFKDLSPDGPAAIISLSGGNELFVERKDQTHYYIITIQAAHEHRTGEVIPLELTEESDGTQRLLNLIPALHRLQTSGDVFFIDEIDRSLHPILILNFLRFFLKSCQGGGSQILVTTHESNLLDLDLLRRDEIWFAEKDQEGSTRLYSLMDFKVRKDHEIRKHYLQGRFGAVPFLGNLDCLLADQAQPK